MRRMLPLFLSALAGIAAAALPAAAHDMVFTTAQPYVIEKTCDDNFMHCTARMSYAPGQHAGLAGAGSYWYQSASSWQSYGYSNRKHVRWCQSHYRTYDPGTDSYVGKGYRHHRCDSPFDGI